MAESIPKSTLNEAIDLRLTVLETRNASGGYVIIARQPGKKVSVTKLLNGFFATVASS